MARSAAMVAGLGVLGAIAAPSSVSAQESVPTQERRVEVVQVPKLELEALTRFQSFGNVYHWGIGGGVHLDLGKWNLGVAGGILIPLMDAAHYRSVQQLPLTITYQGEGGDTLTQYGTLQPINHYNGFAEAVLDRKIWLGESLDFLLGGSLGLVTRKSESLKSTGTRYIFTLPSGEPRINDTELKAHPADDQGTNYGLTLRLRTGLELGDFLRVITEYGWQFNGLNNLGPGRDNGQSVVVNIGVNF